MSTLLFVLLFVPPRVSRMGTFYTVSYVAAQEDDKCCEKREEMLRNDSMWRAGELSGSAFSLAYNC